MKSTSELLNQFKRELPKADITDVYDDNAELLVRILYNGRADYYFIRKSDGFTRAYYSGTEAVRVSNIIQNNKKLNIQNEE